MMNGYIIILQKVLELEILLTIQKLFLGLLLKIRRDFTAKRHNEVNSFTIILIYKLSFIRQKALGL